MMYIKLFNSWKLDSLEEAMNDFLNDYDKGDILNVDVKTNITHDDLNDKVTFYYTGMISYDEPRV